ncbi:phosphotransferase family protein [Halobaculum lipolyticum]|uniref:Phosphotransferase n=1 Tax=Halobaculum lipolyticum TaxID=3032001 RepID=A0ABD5WCC9_9EURY|nr:phosphotransferase [Halobaculum sp. DT31]
MTGEDLPDGRDTDDEVVAAVAGAFPTREVAAVAPVRTGNRKRTVVVRLAGEEPPQSVVVQTAPDAAVLRTEAALARSIGARTPLPVPAVVAGGSFPDRTSAYLVTEHAPGEDLHTRFVDLPAGTRETMAREFGGFLAALHGAFAFEGYGPVALDEAGGASGPARGQPPRSPDDAEPDLEVEGTAWAAVLDAADPGERLAVDVAGGAGDTREPAAADGPEYPGDPDGSVPPATADWPAWLARYASAGVDALPAAFDDLRPRIEGAIADARETLPASPPATLYPWDLRPGNALVADGTVTAVLDWGQPLSAAPGLAVAKAEHLVCDWYVDDGAPLRAAFRAGYRDRRPLPPVPAVYRLVAVVRSAVDGAGVVTRPRYPEVDGDDALAFHRERIEAALDG